MKSTMEKKTLSMACTLLSINSPIMECSTFLGGEISVQFKGDLLAYKKFEFECMH